MGRVISVAFDEAKHTPVDTGTDVQQGAVISIEVARLRRALRRLPMLERRVLEHRYGLGGTPELSTRQVAARLGIPRSTVWDTEQRALDMLRRDFGVRVAA